MTAYAVRVGTTSSPPAFVPGETMPFYEHTEALDGAKNVGNYPNSAFGYTPTTYTGTITNGVATLTNGATYENILFPCVVDMRNSEHLINCRIVVPASYTTTADTIKACVQMLNGAGNSNPRLTNTEIHNRAQRPMNGISGRNGTCRQVVITGCVDGWSTSGAGGAPKLGVAFTIYDSVCTESAWWYSPTVNPDIHGSDTQSHGDCFQHGDATLKLYIENTALGAYVSEIIGTGTPGSGSETNPYVPTNYNYIQSQATLEGWRSSLCSYMTTPSQSMRGIARRLPSSGGSLAAGMINRDNVELVHCWIGGGLAMINAEDNNLPTSMNVRIRDTTFFNDMKNGHTGGDPLDKGDAVLIDTGKALAQFSGNQFFDGTAVTITYK